MFFATGSVGYEAVRPWFWSAAYADFHLAKRLTAWTNSYSFSLARSATEHEKRHAEKHRQSERSLLG